MNSALVPRLAAHVDSQLSCNNSLNPMNSSRSSVGSSGVRFIAFRCTFTVHKTGALHFARFQSKETKKNRHTFFVRLCRLRLMAHYAHKTSNFLFQSHVVRDSTQKNVYWVVNVSSIFWNFHSANNSWIMNTFQLIQCEFWEVYFFWFQGALCRLRKSCVAHSPAWN